jgi:hypothetical protein
MAQYEQVELISGEMKRWIFGLEIETSTQLEQLLL